MNICTKKEFLQLGKKLEVCSQACPVISETFLKVAACEPFHVDLEDGSWGLHREVSVLVDFVFILAGAIQT